MAVITPDSQTALGGYDYQFVEVPSPDCLMCNIYHYPSKKPVLACVAGMCFVSLALMGQNKLLYHQLPSMSSWRIWNNPPQASSKESKYFCSSKEKVCEWQGEVNHIDNHLENTVGCQYVDAECSNGCGKIMQWKLLNNHEQNECSHCKVDCKYCSDVIL